MASRELLDQAEAKRREMIRHLAMCRCAYPIKRYRNGSGHAPNCPTHLDRPLRPLAHNDGRDDDNDVS